MKSVIGLIGNTPVVELERLNPTRGVRIFAKLEKFNPGGSVKDRIALYMVEKAERDGTLTMDKTIIEPTSGNTGIGLAIVGAAKGYRVQLVMPENMSIERRLILQAHGAEIILTPESEGMNGAEDLAKELARDTDRYFMPNQFANSANVNAHYEGTGKELLRQVPDVTHFVAGMGTGGTLMGAGRRLKEYNSKIKVIGVEPHKETPIQGLKNMEISYVPEIFDRSKLDETIVVRREHAFGMARALAREEGLLVGMSSGAAMHAAVEVAKRVETGSIVVLFPDGGEKYLTTELYKEVPESCRRCNLKVVELKKSMEEVAAKRL
ncbi:MAG: cysteine synthase family protein [archaeon]